ncbi:TrmH family RNA methyltransferase [Actinospica acidithermotolerans]|uniref:TrmH family RNA methyltransferase n=1 Tax=Actinospica acidithermotolerans TaxID=2828514 RepID=UPI0027DB4D28|nr:TrmH family RNA methyltransferase [Actinospica acidithermotolerans]
MERITSRNARFQQWEALLGNRSKRHRAGEFLVQGVRPIGLALQYGWPVHALLFDLDRPLSRWAADTLRSTRTAQYGMAGELIAELGEKDSTPPELIAVVGMAPDSLDRLNGRPGATAGADAFLGLVFDRPTSPGNLGSIIRSADAFGAHGVIVSGHAADPYDPKAVRASTGSLFALPTVRVPGHAQVQEWIAGRRAAGSPIQVVGTDEHGEADVAEFDLTVPTLLAIGNETNGLSQGWREACDALVRIPIGGAASSLNAANAASVVLYEAARQRHSTAR